jgi:hypothetical protein
MVLSLGTCRWCSKIIERDDWLVNNRPCCSKECRDKLSAAIQCKEWKSLTPFEQSQWKWSMRKWYEELEQKRVEKVKLRLTKSKKPLTQGIRGNASTILRAHSELMGNDPEALTSAFIRNLYYKR